MLFVCFLGGGIIFLGQFVTVRIIAYISSKGTDKQNFHHITFFYSPFYQVHLVHCKGNIWILRCIKSLLMC